MELVLAALEVVCALVVVVVDVDPVLAVLGLLWLDVDGETVLELVEL